MNVCCGSCLARVWFQSVRRYSRNISASTSPRCQSRRSRSRDTSQSVIQCARRRCARSAVPSGSSSHCGSSASPTAPRGSHSSPPGTANTALTGRCVARKGHGGKLSPKLPSCPPPTNLFYLRLMYHRMSQMGKERVKEGKEREGEEGRGKGKEGRNREEGKGKGRMK